MRVGGGEKESDGVLSALSQLPCSMRIPASGLAGSCVCFSCTGGRRQQAREPCCACQTEFGYPRGCDSGENSLTDVLRRAGGGKLTPCLG